MRRFTDAAFTFVEVLAALAFLGVLMPVIIAALLGSSRASVTADRSEIATQLAENRLGELMLANAWTTAETRGDFGADHPGYRWELTQADWESGSMVELTLGVFFPVQGQERAVHLSTLVSDSLTSQ